MQPGLAFSQTKVLLLWFSLRNHLTFVSFYPVTERLGPCYFGQGALKKLSAPLSAKRGVREHRALYGQRLIVFHANCSPTRFYFFCSSLDYNYLPAVILTCTYGDPLHFLEPPSQFHCNLYCISINALICLFPKGGGNVYGSWYEIILCNLDVISSRNFRFL